MDNADEQWLVALKDDNIDMKDTALAGRYNEKRLQETEKALDGMDPMERVELFKKYENEDDGEIVREVTQSQLVWEIEVST